MKMTVTGGIQKFCCREKIKHLSKYWVVVNRSNIGGRDPCNPCGIDAYERHRIRRPAATNVTCRVVCLAVLDTRTGVSRP